jgi:hypothetical protein
VVALLSVRVDVMPGDPKECRRHAARCAEMAVAARSPQLKITFLELSKNWEKLAIQLENAFAQLAEDEALKVERPRVPRRGSPASENAISKTTPPSIGPGTLPRIGSSSFVLASAGSPP